MNHNHNKRNNNNQRNKTTNKQSAYSLAKDTLYTNKENPRSGLSTHKFMIMKYNMLLTNSLPTGTGAQQTMNLNSIFDPDRTGAGHQPFYYDQMALNYNRYRVLKVQWKVTFAPATNPVYGLVVPVNGLLSSAITTAATFETASEISRSISSTIGTSMPFKVRGGVSLNDLNGCSALEYLTDDRFEAVFTTSPSEVITLVVGIYNPNGVTVAVNMSIEILFHVDLHDPISVAGS